jgi:hypothetical protein
VKGTNVTVHTASATTLSWIPSESIECAPLLRAPFTAGVLHYDRPPPDRLPVGSSLDELADHDMLRFAHRLTASIEVEDGQIVAARYDDEHSRGAMGGTSVRVAGLTTRLAAIGLPLLRQDPVVDGPTAVFEQTFGGHTGLPAPRVVADRPRTRWRAPIVWTTLRLTLHADGHREVAMPGASCFPRHWIYGPDGTMLSKSAVTAFNDWYHGAHIEHTPWSDENGAALVVDVESAIERLLSTVIMRSGSQPTVRALDPGDLLIEQGGRAGPIYVILDGVLSVDVDGEALGEIGPGAVVGERANLEGDNRTATVRALTHVRVAAATFDQVEADLLRQLSANHHREDGCGSGFV